MSARRTHNVRWHSAFTLVELVVAIVVIVTLIALLLPSVRISGGASRRIQCANHLKQIGLALHNYHDTYACFPSAMSTTDTANRLSGFVPLLPFMEQQALYDQISSPLTSNGVTYPAMGPAPWVAEYPPWRARLHALRCSSARNNQSTFGPTNYAFCIGDVTRSIHQPKHLRGAFACGRYSRFADILDGTSHTIAVGEIGTIDDRSLAGQFATQQPLHFVNRPGACLTLREARNRRNYAARVVLDDLGRGGRWADGFAGYTLFATVLPPNSPSCAVQGTDPVDGVYSGGSFHRRGMQVVMVDASVQFITDDVDAGDPTQPPLSDEQMAARGVASPYGVWGALGTAAGAEERRE